MRLFPAENQSEVGQIQPEYQLTQESARIGVLDFRREKAWHVTMGWHLIKAIAPAVSPPHS
jgi:hypothetical protein